MQSEYEYYAGLSGLTPTQNFSLSDHKLAYWRTETGLSTGSLADAEMAFLREALLDEQDFESLSDLQYRYFSGLSGLSPAEQYSLADHKLAVFN